MQEQKQTISVKIVDEKRREKNKSEVPKSPARYCASEKSSNAISEAPREYFIAVKMPVKSPRRTKITRKKVVFLFSLNPSKNLYFKPQNRLESCLDFIV